MIHIIDHLLVKSGMECDELRRIAYRPMLYLGIFFSAVLATVFISLTAMAWLYPAA